MEIRRKEAKRKLNIFDILIIFIVVACIAAIFLRIYFVSRQTMSGEAVTIRFEVSDISPENAAAFTPESTLFLQEDDSIIGSFKEINVIDTRITDITIPNSKTVQGTAVILGKWAEKGFMLNGTTLISLGTTIDVYTDKNIFTLTVIGILENEI